MRILLANSSHPRTFRGGAEAAVVDLARCLIQRGHSVALVVHHKGGELQAFDEGGVRTYALPNRNLYFAFNGARHLATKRLVWHMLDSANPWMASAFGRILDIERPDVVNTNVLAGLSQLVWREAKRRGTPVVHYLHEYGSMCPRGTSFRNGEACGKQCTTCRLIAAPRKRLSALVDTVVGASRFTLDRHLAWGLFPNARTEVIPNIFAGLTFRGRHSTKDGPLRLGYFGRLIPDKGAHLLIKALERLPRSGWTLDIAGEGGEDYVKRLRDAAPNNVRFLGWVSADDFFPEIDLMVIPSLWPEPQPRSTFEAFTYGVPVAGSRVGGIPEQIEEGSTGWLFEPGSVEDLARNLLQLLQDRADRSLTAHAFQHRLNLLEPDHVAARYEIVYREAAGIDRGHAH
jgi:glycosyltransferase involved in cell wall biosynthesis